VNELTVAVLFRNNKNLVAPFFYFLRRATSIKLNVIALDNGSTDGTSEEIEKYYGKNDRLIRLGNNIGTSKGRNVILNDKMERDGKYGDILFIDSDVFIIKNGSIDNIVKDVADIVGVKIKSFWEGNFITEGGICCCLIREKVWDELKKFNEEYFNYYDDSDFFKRARKNNFTFSLCKKAEVLHVWGATNILGTEKDTRVESLKKDKAIFERDWGSE